MWHLTIWISTHIKWNVISSAIKLTLRVLQTEFPTPYDQLKVFLNFSSCSRSEISNQINILEQGMARKNIYIQP